MKKCCGNCEFYEGDSKTGVCTSETTKRSEVRFGDWACKQWELEHGEKIDRMRAQGIVTAARESYQQKLWESNNIRPTTKKEEPVTAMEHDFKVAIPRAVFERCIEVARMAEPNEVQLLGEVDFDGKTLRMTAVHLIRQRVTSGSADFDDLALAKFIGEHPNPQNLRGWVHSHVHMGLFWSATDAATIRRLAPQGWLLSIVMVCSGQMKARLDIDLEKVHHALRAAPEKFAPEFQNVLLGPRRMTWDDLPILVEEVLSQEDKAAIKRELDTALRLGTDETRVQTTASPSQAPSRFLERPATGTPGTLGTNSICSACKGWHPNEDDGSKFKLGLCLPRTQKSGWNIYRYAEAPACAGFFTDVPPEAPKFQCGTCRFNTRNPECEGGIQRTADFLADPRPCEMWEGPVPSDSSEEEFLETSEKIGIKGEDFGYPTDKE